MKHLNKIHANVVAGGAVALEADAIAMEGVAETLKAGWNAIKSAFSPSDHSALISRLNYLPKMREGLIDAKRQVSQGKDDGQFTKNIHRFTQHMPVSATTADQLVKELAAYRKRITALLIAAERAKTPDQIKQYRQQMLVELSKKGHVAKDIVFTKKSVIQILDESIALLDVLADAGGWYKKAYAEAGNQAKVATESLAMESYEDAFEIALESVTSVIAGSLILFASVVARVMMYFAYLSCIGSVLTGQFAAAAGFYLVGYALQWVSQAGIDKATDMITED